MHDESGGAFRVLHCFSCEKERRRTEKASLFVVCFVFEWCNKDRSASLAQPLRLSLSLYCKVLSLIDINPCLLGRVLLGSVLEKKGKEKEKGKRKTKKKP